MINFERVYLESIGNLFDEKFILDYKIPPEHDIKISIKKINSDYDEIMNIKFADEFDDEDYLVKKNCMNLSVI